MSSARTNDRRAARPRIRVRSVTRKRTLLEVAGDVDDEVDSAGGPGRHVGVDGDVDAALVGQGKEGAVAGGEVRDRPVDDTRVGPRRAGRVDDEVAVVAGR